MSSSAPIGPKTVLIVEDNPHDREIYRLALEQSGYEVHTAANWKDGLEAVGDHQPDLILLDLILPGDTGWKAAEELRRNPRTKSIPIIVVSAHVVPKFDSTLRALGVECCLEKPLDPDEVVAQITRLIGAASPG